MKKLTLLFALFFICLFTSKASIDFRNQQAVIFTESNVEFAIYPDGQFDFYYLPAQPIRINTQSSMVNISFNAGYNYNPFIQFDDYGAVVQIERVPIYYDYYGRVTRIGNTNLYYNRFGQLSQIGNLRIRYNRYGNISNYIGYINYNNQQYIYRPWHQFYCKPTRVIVYSQPYRAYYQPRRLSYNSFRSNYQNRSNYRNNFYEPSASIGNYNRGTKTASTTNIRSSGINNTSSINTRRNNTRELSRENERKLSTVERLPSSRNEGRNERVSSETTTRTEKNTSVRKPNTYNSRKSNTSAARSSAASSRR
ncbi:hypothetical protein [Mesonia aquimarina]|uniref:hypothetical protein n=1 Tax=Mesonia aquimarina TaxID=1504967 RepID=UPI000EF5C133|nr:hypothetical protein [Mesonia aquimarina]